MLGAVFWVKPMHPIQLDPASPPILFLLTNAPVKATEDDPRTCDLAPPPMWEILMEFHLSLTLPTRFLCLSL